MEGEIGRFHHRHLVPVPKVATIREPNDLIAKGMAADVNRQIPSTLERGRAFRPGDARAVPLPAAFDPSVISSHRVDRKARVSVRDRCIRCRPALWAGVSARRLSVLRSALSDATGR